MPVYNSGDLTIHHPENIHFAEPTPTTSARCFALSIRLFSSSETIDTEAKKRYMEFLAANRD